MLLSSRFTSKQVHCRCRSTFGTHFTCNLDLYKPSHIYMYLQSRLGPQKMKDTVEIQNYVCSYFSMVNHTHLSSKILRSIRHVSANLLLKFWSPQYTSDAPLHSKTTSECVPWDFENTADFSTQRHNGQDRTCPGCFCHTSQDESALWRHCIISLQRTR